MIALPDLIPKVDKLLSMPSEQLADSVLKVCAARQEAGTFDPARAFLVMRGFGMASEAHTPYKPDRAEAVLAAVARALEHLVGAGLIAFAPGPLQVAWRLRVTSQGHERLQALSAGMQKTFVLHIDFGDEHPWSLLDPIVQRTGATKSVRCERSSGPEVYRNVVSITGVFPHEDGTMIALLGGAIAAA